jgi:hypothetical protein
MHLYVRFEGYVVSISVPCSPYVWHPFIFSFEVLSQMYSVKCSCKTLTGPKICSDGWMSDVFGPGEISSPYIRHPSFIILALQVQQPLRWLMMMR